MTTAKDLYLLPCTVKEEWPKRLQSIEEHFYEFPGGIPYGLDVSDIDFEIKVLKDHCYDGRRTWTLKTVWFEGIPFMITQNAGREGEDYMERFVTNEEIYLKFVYKIIEKIWFYSENAIIHSNEDREDLDSFYGQNINEPFPYYN